MVFLYNANINIITTHQTNIVCLAYSDLTHYSHASARKQSCPVRQVVENALANA